MKTVTAYHGGRFGKKAKWFSSSPKVAGSYGKITWDRYGIPQFDDYQTYEISFSNPFVVNAKGAYYFDIPTPKAMRNDWSSDTVDTDGIADWAYEHGYDSVIIKNVEEGHGYSEIATDYVLFTDNYRLIEESPVESSITETLNRLKDLLEM